MKTFLLALLLSTLALTRARAGHETAEQHLARYKNTMRGVFLENGWIMTSETPNQQEFSHPLGPTSALLAGLAQTGQDGLLHVQITFQPQDDGPIRTYLAWKPVSTKADRQTVQGLIDLAGSRMDASSKKLGVNYKPKEAAKK